MSKGIIGRKPRAALLAAGLLGALAVAPGADAAVQSTKTVNQQVPDATAAANGLLTSTISVPAQGKKKKIRDVNVTVKTTGSVAGAAADLVAKLTAPNGATTTLFANSLGGQSVGPLTLDDETFRTLSALASPPAPTDPTLLYQPYSGTAQPGGTLSVMDNSPVKGTWTLRVVDNAAGKTTTLDSWSINVRNGKAYKKAGGRR